MHLATFPMALIRAVCAMGAVEEDPVIGRGSGVKKVVVYFYTTFIRAITSLLSLHLKVKA